MKVKVNKKECDFIVKAIDKIFLKFKGIDIKYDYDENTNYHIIQVWPEDIRRGNEEYKKDEMKLYTSFTEKFPESNILITSRDDMNYAYVGLRSICHCWWNVDIDGRNYNMKMLWEY